jgi:hypothetical protein
VARLRERVDSADIKADPASVYWPAAAQDLMDMHNALEDPTRSRSGGPVNLKLAENPAVKRSLGYHLMCFPPAPTDAKMDKNRKLRLAVCVAFLDALIPFLDAAEDTKDSAGGTVFNMGPATTPQDLACILLAIFYAAEHIKGWGDVESAVGRALAPYTSGSFFDMKPQAIFKPGDAAIAITQDNKIPDIWTTAHWSSVGKYAIDNGARASRGLATTQFVLFEIKQAGTLWVGGQEVRIYARDQLNEGMLNRWLKAAGPSCQIEQTCFDCLTGSPDWATRDRQDVAAVALLQSLTLVAPIF